MYIYCINLDHRTDRWNNIKNQFNDMEEYHLIRFPAIKHQYGWIGCGLSHLKLIESFFDDKKDLIIIEDDCMIQPENFLLKFTKIYEWLDNNRDEWEIFNGNPSFVNIKKAKILDTTLGIIKCTGGTANFIIYNYKKYKQIILKFEKYKKHLNQWINNIELHNVKVPHSHKYLPIIDKFLPNNFICVTSVPYITSQSASQSDIEKKEVNYNNILTVSEKKLLILLNT